jgi:threonine/homoserine/homoserine lactone efflux protein
MEAAAFLKGLLLGFSIAAPIGPIGVLCIRRTLHGGMGSGVMSGLGTAVADAAYGLIAAFGVTAVSSLLLEHNAALRLCGGLFLIYLGCGIFRSHPAEIPSGGPLTSRFGDFGSAFILTLTNPLTILSFTAVFAGFGAGDTPGNYGLAAILVGGVLSGSLIWWVLLAGAVGLFRSRFDQRKLIFVNRISGAMISIFGLVSLASLWS